MELSQELAVNANKFRKSKFLLLFSIQEKDENDVAIGHLDNAVRKKIMSTCYTSIKLKQIGPGSSKGSFILSNKKL